MMFGIVACEVLSATDSAVEVIPGTDATTSKLGALGSGDGSPPFRMA
jgi:hypothetical protein